MRNITFLFFALLISQLGLSQTINERKMSMSLGVQNAYIVDVPNATAKMMEESWNQKLSGSGKPKVNKKAKEAFLMDANLPNVTSGTVHIYAKFEENKGQGSAYFWLDTKKEFLSTEVNAEISEKFKFWLNEYSLDVLKKVYNEELKNEEKNLSNLDRDMKKLKDKNSDYHKDIEKAKQRIAQAEKDIEKNLQEQDAKQAEIEGQKIIVEKAKDKINSIGRG